MNRKRIAIIIAGAMILTPMQAGVISHAVQLHKENGYVEAGINQQTNELMGNIQDYGAIVFGNATMEGGDSETSFAIGGNLSAPLGGGSFTLATANEQYSRGTVVIGEPINMQNRCGLLLGGILDPNGLKSNNTSGNIGKLNVEAPNIITTGKEADPYNQLKTSETWNGTNIEYANKNIVENKFNDFKEYAIKTLGNATSTIQGLGNNTWSMYKTDTNGNIAVNKLANENGTTTIENINVPENMAINNTNGQNTNNFTVIYSDAKIINFSDFNLSVENQQINDGTPLNSLNSEASKVIYAFPNATNINISDSSIIGSIIAPNATLNLKGGFINGQIVAQNFNKTKGGEIHSFYFQWEKFNNLFRNAMITVKNSETGKVLPNATVTVNGTTYTTGVNGTVTINN
uniref:collagen-binding domain-containing protein n=1 Tax=uncultured Clostridium sp. TaxID=59620 RepID=UPI00262AFE7C